MANLVEIDGINYIPRIVDIPFQQAVTVASSLTAGTVVLNGTAKVMVNAIGREVLDATGASVVRRFKFRWGMSDGGVQFSYAGIGNTNNRVVDSLYFGNGQFPRAFTVPPIFDRSVTISYEVEDLSATVPYTIHFNLMSVYLIPA